MTLRDIITKYALHNAIKYNGIANPKAVLGGVLGESKEARKNIKEVLKKIEETVKEVNKLGVEEQKRRLNKLAPELLKEKKSMPELPDLKVKNVVLRFAPSPSGALHVGHAYVLLLNYLLASKHEGKVIVRIEDTNPDNIYPGAYDLIIEDAEWLTNKGISKFVVQSDRMHIYYNYAKKIIEMNKAYICTCDSEVFRNLKLKKTVCPCRELSVKENLKRWGQMLNEFKPGTAVMRIKTDLGHNNPAIRDWPAFRINDSEHPRTKNKFRVWPLMNFAVAVDDHELKVTHAVRGKDHVDNEKKQKYLFDYFGWQEPRYLYIGRINFEGMPIKSSEVRKKIENKEYEGWDDIRLPFIPALRRRGYQPEAFLKYARDVGVSSNDKRVRKDDFFKSLNFNNKEVVDNIANRYFFVKDPVDLRICGAKKKKVKLRLHPERKTGFRLFNTEEEFLIQKDDFKEIREGELYRLMDCLNFVKKKGKFFYDSEDYQKYKQKGKRIMHWLPKGDYVTAEVRMPNNKIAKGAIEKNIMNEKKGSVVQLERFGFCRIDAISDNNVALWFAHK